MNKEERRRVQRREGKKGTETRPKEMGIGEGKEREWQGRDIKKGDGSEGKYREGRERKRKERHGWKE